jgi:hypothetical protein
MKPLTEFQGKTKMKLLTEASATCVNVNILFFMPKNGSFLPLNVLLAKVT